MYFPLLLLAWLATGASAAAGREAGDSPRPPLAAAATGRCAFPVAGQAGKAAWLAQALQSLLLSYDLDSRLRRATDV